MSMCPRETTPLTMPLPSQFDASRTITPPQITTVHAAEIDRYNAWTEQREPYSQRVRRWRAGQRPSNQSKP